MIGVLPKTTTIEFTINFSKVGDFSLNKLYAGMHWSTRKRQADEWHWRVVSALKEAGIKKRMFEAPVRIAFAWPGKLDLDNTAYMRKMIIDALKGYLIEDDDRRYIIGLSDEIGTGKGIKVTVRT